VLLQYAATSFQLGEALASAETAIERLPGSRSADTPVPDHVREAVASLLAKTATHIEIGDFQFVEPAFRRLREILASDCTVGRAKEQIQAFRHQVMGELRSKLYFYLDRDQAVRYLDEQPFGAEVAKSFPSMAPELSEAAKCFALERYTATVGHLMRSLETPLMLFAQRFSVTAGARPWGAIINDIEDAMASIPKKGGAKPTDWGANKQFYTEAAGQFFNFKEAWRNYVAHGRATYERGAALDISNATQAFSQHLAKQLAE